MIVFNTLRVLLTAAVAIALFFIFRVAVPAAVNMHNDGGLALAVVLALAAPALAFLGLYFLWTKENL